MPIDVFISYSSKDKLIADAACATLEAAGIRCWIAPRDIRAGDEYGESIIQAIGACRVMVLVFSSNSNDSQQIHREIERAVSKGVPLVPLRIEEITPTKSMEYFLGGIHWLDALTPPIERHLQRLAETVKALLQADATRPARRPETGQAAAVARPAPTSTEVSTRRLEDRTGDAGMQVRRHRIRALAAAALVGLGFVTGGIWLSSRIGHAPVEDSRTNDLIPEQVPFISDRDRALVRAEYLPAPAHKALAIGNQAGFVTGRKDIDSAKVAALAACQKLATRDFRKCELYAIGNKVVYAAGRPPMPPEPWFVRNPAVERPFVSSEVPLLSNAERGQLQGAQLPRSWALAISSRSWSYFRGHASADEAIRRSLESCGNYSGIACLVVAVDDVFVVPIPTRLKAVRIFRASQESAITPEARDDVAKRLANAPNGWNAVAVGSAGSPGLMLKASTEQAAIDGALADCARRDASCRIIAIGPFFVEPGEPAER